MLSRSQSLKGQLNVAEPQAKLHRETEIRSKLADLQRQGFRSASERAASIFMKSDPNRSSRGRACTLRATEAKDDRMVLQKEFLIKLKSSLLGAGAAKHPRGPSLGDALCCTSGANARANRLWGAEGDHEVAMSIRQRGAQSAKLRRGVQSSFYRLPSHVSATVGSTCSKSTESPVSSIVMHSPVSKNTTSTTRDLSTIQHADFKKAQIWWMERVAMESQVASARKKLINQT